MIRMYTVGLKRVWQQDVNEEHIRSYSRISAVIFRKWIAALRLSGCVVTIFAALMGPSSAREHQGNPGNQMHQQSYHGPDKGRDYYRDPFWGSWYPGYSGVYDSSYWYTPTAEQRAAAEKQVQAYIAAVKKKRKHAARHRYIAVQTLRPTTKQLQDYVNKRAAANSAAANGNAQLSNRWVAPNQLRCIMVFDTQSKQFVGSGCYVVASNPPVGATAKFETFTAEFVGGSEL